MPFRDADRLFALRLADPVKQEVYGTLPGEAVEAVRARSGSSTPSPRSPAAGVLRPRGRRPRAVVARAGVTAVPRSARRPPVLGRAFEPGDIGTHALILTYRTWMQRYGGDQAVIGRLIPAILRPTESYSLTQQPLCIVGVLPPRLPLPLIADTEALVLDHEVPGAEGRWCAPLVRLREDVSLAAAQAALEGVRASELEPERASFDCCRGARNWPGVRTRCCGCSCAPPR